MKIIFICGSLEPGRDGVGDYTRRLVGELIKLGHHPAVVAINDYFVTELLFTSQNSEGYELPTLRVPSTWTERERFNKADKWISAFDPKWLSLQFVPFAFHAQGISMKLNRYLRKIGAGRNWHVMFHELWVGMNKESPPRQKLLGWIQKQFIKSLILQLKPKVIHTHTQLYKACILDLGFDANYLPLFSNIPLFNSDFLKYDSSKGDSVALVVFGSIHPESPVREFAREISQFAQKYKRNIYLTIIGRCGKEQSVWEGTFASEGIGVRNLGEQSLESVSKVLQISTWGVSTTPFLLAEKSGTIAAMQQHGLPVICVTSPWSVSKYKDEAMSLSGVYEYKAGNIELIFASKESCHVRGIQPASVAKHMIKALDSFSTD